MQEQGETQHKFSMVDVWLDYKAKSDAGMIQQEIADVLGLGRTIVVYRIKLASLPTAVLAEIVTKENVNEGSWRELLECHNCDNFFIPYEETLLEIIENVCSRKINL